ncbi:hypothetical protein D7W82_12300 [Corallococcus sp. CA049B]|uniref:hypothetical protein n=1 Tax=Corallococcus sp. CA049B TaxID=2316730 RepID=UPI000EA03AAB|nr:hypothetical protein [Corallococcus sp. CA049B]NOJ91427.1 hypothetical protein [Corallococcus coralloides]RKG87852.1 hypothetical protein D7W82_12300 [Corallococcus sp. CA049B]
MKLSLAAMVMWVGLSLVGCGGPALDDAMASEAEARTVSQFGTCTATCAGGTSVSCTGTTCTSTDNQGVTCDGVSTACPSSCGGLPSCSLYVNQRCTTPNATKACCNATSHTPDSLLCSGSATTGYRWLNY